MSLIFTQVVAPDLPSDFPPLASLDARPHNLPTRPTALLGRDEAVSEVRALFARDVRLVTLTGPGGTGKTRLSQQVAAELLDQLQDGVWLVEFAPIADPVLVPMTIAQALGLRDFGGALAARLNASFVPARKPGKLPAESDRVSYKTEYSTAELEMHKNSIKRGARVVVVDDVLATGGTAKASAELVATQGGEVVAYAFVIELSFLNGKKVLSPARVESVITY